MLTLKHEGTVEDYIRDFEAL
jgi:hypothetical protein